VGVASLSSSDGERARSSAVPVTTTTPDPFALFGLAPRFDLEPAALEARFRERSREVHPDRHPGASAAERAQAMIRTRALNDAYQVLRRPERRAEHLLAQAGVVIGDHERLEPGFLMEILELREELADARAAARLDRVGALEAAMRSRHQAHLSALTPLFAVALDAGATAAARDEALAGLKRHLITLRYVGRYLEECEAALAESD
jgi:molecular chaperone HscB